MNDLLFLIQYCGLSSYVDDNNLFSISKNKDQIKRFAFSDFKLTSNWSAAYYLIYLTCFLVGDCSDSTLLIIH